MLRERLIDLHGEGGNLTIFNDHQKVLVRQSLQCIERANVRLGATTTRLWVDRICINEEQRPLNEEWSAAVRT